MNQVNYQKELDRLLAKIEGARGAGGAGSVPRLLLHSCCAPCSSACLEILCNYFAVTVFYYNPNISALEEYAHRVSEQKRLIVAYNEEKRGYPIRIIEGDYRPNEFFDAVKGYEACPEGGERCMRCFALRLGETARLAAAERFDYFGTTLTISPLKNAQRINEIGQECAAEVGVQWLPSDFKKKDGYKRSVELSAQYGLYRQDFCGCAFSKAEREAMLKAKAVEACQTDQC